MNPFIYLLAVKNLVFIGKIGLLLKLEERRSLPVTSVLVYRELDMALAEDSVFNSRKQSPEEFAAFFIEVLLPERRLELYLKRDD